MEEGVVGEVRHSISTSPKELFSMSVAVLALLTTLPPPLLQARSATKTPEEGAIAGDGYSPFDWLASDTILQVASFFSAVDARSMLLTNICTASIVSDPTIWSCHLAEAQASFPATDLPAADGCRAREVLHQSLLCLSGSLTRCLSTPHPAWGPAIRAGYVLICMQPTRVQTTRLQLTCGGICALPWAVSVSNTT
jgi:hypothetical protein